MSLYAGRWILRHSMKHDGKAACAGLCRMGDLISQLGEEAMNASTAEGQNRSLLMQQEQLRGLKKAADGALRTASSAMARVTSSLVLPSIGVPRTLKEDFDRLSQPEGDGPETLWHQMRYHRDRSSWVEERDALSVKLAEAQREAESLRTTLGVSFVFALSPFSPFSLPSSLPPSTPQSSDF